MQILKKIVRGLSSFAFVFLIWVLAGTSALVLTFNSPKKIEKSLSDSGVYSTFVNGALKEVNKSNQQNNSPKPYTNNGAHKGSPMTVQVQSSKSNSDDIPIDNPAIVQAANAAFTPQLLQSSTENVLNDTYDWLSGKTAQPIFVIDLTAAKKTFAQQVGEAAQAQLEKLPVCTNAQAKAQGSDINPFTATCRPKGLNIKAQAAKVTNDLATSKDFLGTPVLNANSLAKDKGGKTIFDQAAAAPKVYKWVNASPWVLAVLTLAAGAITLWLYDSKRRGLRNLAISLTVVGGLLLFTTLGATKGLDALSKPTGKLGESLKDNSFQQTILKALHSISTEIEHVIMWFAVAYVVIGVGTLIALHFTKPKTKENDLVKDGPKATDKSAPEANEAPKPAAKPAPKPKTVQG